MMGIRTAGATISVAVVEDDEKMRLGLKGLLESSKDFHLIGTFSNAADALAGIPGLRPDLTLMDLHLPDLNGIECIKRLKMTMPALKIVVVTGARDAKWVSAASKAGAAAYLTKPINIRQFWATLNFAFAGKDDMQPVQTAKAWTAPGGASWHKPPLNPREREILAGLANGMLYKEIADKLGISYAAVHKSQHKLFKKLGVSNRSEAIRVWLSSHDN